MELGPRLGRKAPLGQRTTDSASDRSRPEKNWPRPFIAIIVVRLGRIGPPAADCRSRNRLMSEAVKKSPGSPDMLESTFLTVGSLAAAFRAARSP